MEIHLVHKAESGDIAVLSVLVEPGTKDVVRFPLIGELPKEAGELVEAEHTFRNPIEFIPDDGNHATYTGSFTTPPCTEGIRWIVMTTPIRVHPDVIAEFREILGANNRPVQPLNGRRVSIDSDHPNQ